MRLLATCVSILALGATAYASAQAPVPAVDGEGNSPRSSQISPIAVPNTPSPDGRTFQVSPTTAPLPPLLPVPAALPASNDFPADASPLTLLEAQRTALLKNPGIAISRLLALAQGQTVLEQRAAELPTLTGSITAVTANEGSRITAGALNNPVLYQRAAAGVTLNQLVTDFGRTRSLVAAARLRTQAAESTVAATRSDILFAVDQAFYRTLGAQALIRVATQTVSAQQATAAQVQALANAGLRSTLDLSFANAQLAQAQLLVLDARNQSASAQASLSALLGDPTSQVYRLVDEVPNTPAPAPIDPKALLATAFQNRPDLASLRQQALAQHRFADAEADLKRPTVNILGSAGGAPVRSDLITQSWYGAVGVNVNVPVFNGGLYKARGEEAKLRSQAVDQQVQQLQDNIARDVTTTVLQAQSNFSRIAVAQVLAQQADTALQLAQTRYSLGLSSIVELSQAQLLRTQASIELANARYTYEGSLSAIRYQSGQ